MAAAALVSDLPVIDLQSLMAAGRVRDGAVAALDRAAQEHGFFQLIGHGVPPQHRERLLRAQTAFFARPLEQKLRVVRDVDNARGYNPGELTKNRRDAKEIFDFGHRPDPEAADDAPVNRVLDGWNQFPDDLPGFREANLRWYGYCESLAMILLRAFAEALALPADALETTFGSQHTSFLRLNHYPPQPEPAPPDAPDLPAAGQLGIHHHTDAGVLTLLIQDGATALQVRRNGRWELVEPLDDGFIVNIGDMMQVVSNDRFPAPEHRVLATPQGGRRSSAAFFFNPAYDARIEPLAASPAATGTATGTATGKGSGNGSARYRPFTWGEFRRRRADGDYADLGEEVQISQYRTG